MREIPEKPKVTFHRGNIDPREMREIFHTEEARQREKTPTKEEKMRKSSVWSLFLNFCMWYSVFWVVGFAIYAILLVMKLIFVKAPP